LIDVSNYSIDEIYLFSVELFAKEVTKFDMKEDAASKEAKAAFDKMELENANK